MTIIYEEYPEGADKVSEKGGNVIFMPDIEYKSWVNGNRELLEEVLQTGKVSTLWLAKGKNKSFLMRYFKECGYTVSLDD